MALDRSNNRFLLGLSGAHQGKVFHLFASDDCVEKKATLLADSFSEFSTLLFETLDQYVDRVLDNEIISELDALLGHLPADYKTPSMRTLLEESAALGKVEMVQALLDRGFELGKAVEYGQATLPAEFIEKLVIQDCQKRTGIYKTEDYERQVISNDHTEAHQVFPYTGFSMVLPEGFVLTEPHVFSNAALKARFDLIEKDGTLAQNMLAHSEREWLRRWHLIEFRMPVTINGYEGMFLKVVAAQGESEFLVLLLETDDQRTMQFSAMYPKGQSALEAQLKQALFSVSKTSFDSTTLLDFSVNLSGKPLKWARVKPNNALLSQDSFWPTQHEDQVFLSISSMAEVVLPSQRYAYGQSFFSHNAREELGAATVEAIKDISVDKLPAIVLTGYQEGAELWAAVIFGHGYLYHFFGSTAPGKMGDYQPVFEQILESFSRKPEALAKEMTYREGIAELEKALRKLATEEIAFKLVPSDNIDPLSSHVFGVPVLPAGQTVPMRARSEEPMALICQLLKSDCPALPVSRVQIFADPFRYRETMDVGMDIKVIIGFSESESLEVVQDGWSESALMLNQPKPSRLNFEQKLSLPDWPVIMMSHPDIVSLCRQVYPEAPDMAYQAVQLQMNALPVGHALGGECPMMIRTPMGSDGQPMVFVGKIGSEPEIGLIWRHLGSLWLFCEATDKTKWRWLVQ